MDNNTKLPIPVNQKQIEMKQKLVKVGKALGWSAATLGIATTFIGAFAVSPLLAMPALGGVYFVGKKMLNNTIYESFKDVAFVLRKNRNTAKIFQDESRIDIYNKMLGFNNREKAAFLQLQGLVGLSKCEQLAKNGKPIIYQTISHRPVISILERLDKLGYISEFNAISKGKSHLILPKLSFGNIKDLKDTVNMYDLKFKLTDKKIDLLNDKELQKAFPAVFNEKKGIINKFGLEQEKNGSFTLQYKKQMNLRKNCQSKLLHKKNKLILLKSF